MMTPSSLLASSVPGGKAGLPVGESGSRPILSCLTTGNDQALPGRSRGREAALPLPWAQPAPQSPEGVSGSEADPQAARSGRWLPGPHASTRSLLLAALSTVLHLDSARFHSQPFL